MVAEAIAGGTLGRLTSAVASIPWWRTQEYYDGSAVIHADQLEYLATDGAAEDRSRFVVPAADRFGARKSDGEDVDRLLAATATLGAERVRVMVPALNGASYPALFEGAPGLRPRLGQVEAGPLTCTFNVGTWCSPGSANARGAPGCGSSAR